MALDILEGRWPILSPSILKCPGMPTAPDAPLPPPKEHLPPARLGRVGVGEGALEGVIGLPDALREHVEALLKVGSTSELLAERLATRPEIEPWLGRGVVDDLLEPINFSPAPQLVKRGDSQP